MQGELLNREPIFHNDDKYLVTYPGDHYTVTYQVANSEANEISSYFIKSKGYYIEWIRKEWINNDKPISFNFNDETLIKTAQLWLDKKEDFEQLFYDLKIPLKQSVDYE